jgi:AmmeMemoRadiSam system protein B
MYVRKPAFAGSFYPSSPAELKSVISEYLNSAEDIPVDGDILSLIVPHAGYIYSGPVAAYSFKKLSAMNPDTVLILAPSHRARFEGASVIKEGMYDTPFGSLEIDQEITGKLFKNKSFWYNSTIHDIEHSLEVQVPFIKSVLDKVKIVPVIVGTVDLSAAKKLAEHIAYSLSSSGKKFSIVISTDLSHYHAYDKAVNIDSKFIKALESFEPENVKESLESGRSEACGEGPVLTGMITSKLLGATKTRILKYMNSGDTAGSKKEVVGYLSAAFIK